MTTLNQVHLNGLRAVECVLRGGSLQKAADELGVTASAVSQQIARTEAQLDRKLFERTSTGLTPTSFGQALGRKLTAGFEELAAAVALASDDDNKLNISVAPAFASRWLVQRLMRHFRLYPDVWVRMDASPKLIDLDHSDVSAAIRLGKGDWPGVRAELLFEVQEFPVCAPEIAKDLHRIEDLARTHVITDDNSMLGWEAWFEAAGIPPIKLLDGAHYSDPTLVLEAAIAGHGIMLAWDLLAGEALADGRLVAPFGAKAAAGLGYYVCTSARRQPDIKTRNFIRWLRDEVTGGATASG